MSFTKGDRVLCEVPWRDGRTTKNVGSLMSIRGDEAFVDVDGVGPCAVPVESLEPE